MSGLDPALAAFAKGTADPLAKALDAHRLAPRLVDGFQGAGGRFDGIPIALRLLSNDERARAKGAALAFLTADCGLSEAYLYGTPEGDSELELELKVQLLARALVEGAPPHQPLVKDAEALRRLLDSYEVHELFEHFADFLAESHPLSRAKSAEEVEAVLDALGKGTVPPSRLRSFDSSTLRSSLHSLAVQRWKLTNGSSSPSSPSTVPGETPPSE